MADERRGMAIGHILELISARQDSSLSDGEVLRRFAVERDEAAFELLLRRHGPMVLRTCQRMLGQFADAEDAFQAVFLVLCRKAGSIASGQSLGSWLYKVTYRICLRAKRLRPGGPPAATRSFKAQSSIPPLLLSCEKSASFSMRS